MLLKIVVYGFFAGGERFLHVAERNESSGLQTINIFRSERLADGRFESIFQSSTSKLKTSI